MPVSNLKIIEELCGICADLAKIVTEKQKLLARYTALIGSGEWPDEALGEEL